MIFAGARDGRFGVWRLPERWRAKEIEEVEKEYEQARRQMVKLRKVKR